MDLSQRHDGIDAGAECGQWCNGAQKLFCPADTRLSVYRINAGRNGAGAGISCVWQCAGKTVAAAVPTARFSG